MYEVLAGKGYMSKECSKCKTIKPDEMFPQRGYYKDGRIMRRNDCYDCLRIIDRKRIRGNRSEYFHSIALQRKAKEAVRYALKSGSMVKRACLMCGSNKAEGHHPDYTKPLKVLWLCKKHHVALHKGLRQIGI